VRAKKNTSSQEPLQRTQIKQKRHQRKGCLPPSGRANHCQATVDYQVSNSAANATECKTHTTTTSMCE
jgi:hypothetical protein